MRCNSPLILFCHHVLWESPGTNTLQKALEDTYVNIHMCAQYVCIIEVYIHIYMHMFAKKIYIYILYIYHTPICVYKPGSAISSQLPFSYRAWCALSASSLAAWKQRTGCRLRVGMPEFQVDSDFFGDMYTDIM